MLLDTFIMNTDADSQKLDRTVSMSLTVAEFNLAAGASKSFETSVQVTPGQYFENVYTRCAEIAGDITMVGGDPVYQKEGQFDVYWDVFRSDELHYKLKVTFVNQSGAQITIPTNKTDTNIHLFVAAKR